MKITSSQFRKAIPWLLLIILVILLDQFSKYLVLKNLYVGQPLQLLPFFNFNLSFNQGSAFGFLNQAGGWQVLFLSAVSVVIIILLLIWLLRLSYPNTWTAAALSLVVGGAAGNLIDRVRLSMVVDFLDFHIGSWHYATFNVGDSAIVIGVIMLLLQTFFKERRKNP
jgi:signal peptidase II